MQSRVPNQYYDYQTQQHYRPKQNDWSPRRCLSCCAITTLIFMMTMSFLCVGILLIYPLDPPQPINILVLGSDARPLTSGDLVARTDTIMIVSIDPVDKQVSLLSVPRDLYVTSPNYGFIPINTVVRNAEAYQPGSGVAEMIATLEDTFAIEIDAYARVNFEGFEAVVDAIGGITVDVPKHIIDYEYPAPDYGIMTIEFFPGEQKMDGRTALIYARTRHADDDYQRASRQQQIIDAVLTKFANPLNLRYMPQVWRAIENHIETNLSEGDAIKYLPAIVLYGRSSSKIDRLVIDRNYILPDGNVFIPNVNLLDSWIEDHMRH